MLYNVVIRGNDFDFIKWLGVMLWLFSFPSHGILLTMEEIRDILESNSNGKKETYCESDSDSEAQ